MFLQSAGHGRQRDDAQLDRHRAEGAHRATRISGGRCSGPVAARERGGGDPASGRRRLRTTAVPPRATSRSGRRPFGPVDKVTLWWASANRDEAVFSEPFRFDIRRTPNPHFAFGQRRTFLSRCQPRPPWRSGSSSTRCFGTASTRSRSLDRSSGRAATSTRACATCQSGSARGARVLSEGKNPLPMRREATNEPRLLVPCWREVWRVKLSTLVARASAWLQPRSGFLPSLSQAEACA